jgi:DNA recombination protein RmuC
MSQQVAGQMSSIALVQNNQIDSFSRQLTELTTANERRLVELRETVDAKLGETKEDARKGREENAGTLKRFSESLNQQLIMVQEASDKRLVEMRALIEARLDSIQKDNAEKLEKMRRQWMRSFMRRLNSDWGNHSSWCRIGSNKFTRLGRNADACRGSW